MASTGFQGVYALKAATIDNAVTKTSAGAYVLTKRDPKDAFTVNYVGRSDTDLNARLKSWAAGSNSYTHFKAGYCSSPKAAFEKECHLFHDFGGTKDLDNSVHPARPNNTNWACPVCTIFD